MGLVSAMPAWLFGLTFSLFMRCIASGSILGLVTGSTAGALCSAVVPVVRTGVLHVRASTACTGAVVPVVPVVLGFAARWLGHCRPLGQLPCGKMRVSHLGAPNIMIITVKC